MRALALLACAIVPTSWSAPGVVVLALLAVGFRVEAAILALWRT